MENKSWQAHYGWPATITPAAITFLARFGGEGERVCADQTRVRWNFNRSEQQALERDPPGTVSVPHQGAKCLGLLR